jgi:hypothetical protein
MTQFGIGRLWACELLVDCRPDRFDSHNPALTRHRSQAYRGGKPRQRTADLLADPILLQKAAV